MLECRPFIKITHSMSGVFLLRISMWRAISADNLLLFVTKVGLPFHFLSLTLYPTLEFLVWLPAMPAYISSCFSYIFGQIGCDSRFSPCAKWYSLPKSIICVFVACGWSCITFLSIFTIFIASSFSTRGFFRKHMCLPWCQIVSNLVSWFHSEALSVPHHCLSEYCKHFEHW